MNQKRIIELQSAYDTFQAEELRLDLTRGKPSAEQLDLANDIDGILRGFYILQDGTDVRNYGGLLGIPEARRLGADLIGTDEANVMAAGNSSLTLMYQYIEHQLETWRTLGHETLKFLCPVPGYDRHFSVCEHFGIEMICVEMTETGPNMDQIEALVQRDPSIIGIWCVPKYSNPTGHTYSKETVRRFANLPNLAGNHFQIMWDNAYIVHHINDYPDELPDLFALAKKVGAADQIAIFASTSKITMAGSGVAFMASTPNQLGRFEKYLSDQTIGFDKVNQLRHVHFLKDAAGIEAHMAKHRLLIKPKFDLVLSKLATLDGRNIASWTQPNGGYFISLNTRPGLADVVVDLAAGAGVKLTPAGSTFPYGKDPLNQNIRIAPTYPSIDELDQAMDVFVTCLELATLRD